MLTGLNIADLSVLDALFLPKLSSTARDELAEVFTSRHKKSSVVVTSHRLVDDWGKLIGNVVVVASLTLRALPSHMHSLHRLHLAHHLLHHHLHHVEAVLHMIAHPVPHTLALLRGECIPIAAAHHAVTHRRTVHHPARHHARHHLPTHGAHGVHLLHHGVHVLAQQFFSDLGIRRLMDTPHLPLHELHPSFHRAEMLCGHRRPLGCLSTRRLRRRGRGLGGRDSKYRHAYTRQYH